ncbi:acetolactate synthase large subunit [Gordonia rubripertincta]|uniref:Acetolactate synthase n=1 Tax=Gordonia rubripertincta TaxID=36822 RepID=A0AAW6RH52_GORRU|nr:acetolactate synthase large subunit [Gordonia rubripertincta]MDG6783781.1 acetolactate synthase large subunit [Gordonia rubripertincta]NKY65983.1 acetolactate synthase large subunit [Gordonia rubripertincta]
MTTLDADAAPRRRRVRPTPNDLAGTRTGADPRDRMRMSGALALVCGLEALHVEAVFGMPTPDLLPVWEPLSDSPGVRAVRVRHEQGAGHAAAGYAASTGRTGVFVAGAGAGATNSITALADANMDSVPVVAIAVQVDRDDIGTDSSRDVDVIGITRSITKHSFLVTDAGDLPRILAEAFHIAATGRPGPVVVAVPSDVLSATTTFDWPAEVDLPGYEFPTTVSDDSIWSAAEEILAASAPVLYVGGGVVRASAADALRELAELTGIPVVTTLMARGAFPDGHPLHYGMPGMHGSVAAVAALQKSDLIVALGARFDDRVTGAARSFAPDARVIHVDIDPAEIGKNRRADIGIVGHARTAIRALSRALRPELARGRKPDIGHWVGYLDRMRTDYPLSYDDPADGSLSPERVIETVSKLSSSGTIFASGVGQHQMWAANFVRFDAPRTWLNSGGLGTMGYSVPAAIGAQVGNPDREVWAVDGDGCFQMTGRELACAAEEGLPIKVALINNGNLGMVRQLQTVHYQGRHHSVDLATLTRRVPDFVVFAEALGCVGLRCERRDQLEETIELARAVTDRPVVIDFVVGDDLMVWPMIAAGASNNEILVADGIRPLFDGLE